jgi:hypothetical protein
MSLPFRKLLCAGFACLICAHSVCSQKTEAEATPDEVASAQTTTYCEVQQYPERFKNRMIRIRALYETGFETSIITAPSCNTPTPMTWVTFDKLWESRSARGVRRSISRLKWGVQADVVFIGLFKSDGRFGHMDMYPLSIEVYRVEAVHPSGSFRPMPD